MPDDQTISVRMPDGTLVTGVPPNATKRDILRRYGDYKLASAGTQSPSRETRRGFVAGVGESVGIPSWSSVRSFMAKARRDPLGTAEGIGLGAVDVVKFAAQHPSQFAWAMTNIPQMKEAWGKGNYSEAAGILAGTVPQFAVMFLGEEGILARAGMAARGAKARLAGRTAEEFRAAEAARKAQLAAKPGMVKSIARSVTGAGPRLIEKAEDKRAATVAEQEAKYQSQLSEATAKYEQALSKYTDLSRQKLAGARQAHEAELSEYRRNLSQAKSEYDRIRAAGAKRMALRAARERLLATAMQSTKAAYGVIKQNFNSRWAALRAKVGEGTFVDMVPVANAITKARTEILHGFPEDLRGFDQLLNEPLAGAPEEVSRREILKQATVFKGGGVPPGTTSLKDVLQRLGADQETKDRIYRQLAEAGEGGNLPSPAAAEAGNVTWAGAQDRYTSLNDKLYRGADPFTGRPMAPNVKRALASVRDALGATMKRSAEKAGAGTEYERLRSDYAQFMDDWHDLGSEARGGSPLARLLRSVDPEHAATPLAGKASDRLISQLARYEKFGARPGIALALRRIRESVAALPKVTAEQMREPFVAPEGLREPTVASIQVPKPPEFKPPTRPASVAPLDREALRTQAVADTAKRVGRYGAFRATIAIEELVRQALFGRFVQGVVEAAGLVGGPAALRRILETPSVQKWIAAEERTRGVSLRPRIREAIRKLTLASRPAAAIEYAAGQHQ